MYVMYALAYTRRNPEESLELINKSYELAMRCMILSAANTVGGASESDKIAFFTKAFDKAVGGV